MDGDVTESEQVFRDANEDDDDDESGESSSCEVQLVCMRERVL